MSERPPVPQPDLAEVVAGFVSWIAQTLASDGKRPELVLQSLCERLIGHGIPLRRSSTSLLTMHPEIRNQECEWWRESGAMARPRPHQVLATPAYMGSPIEEVFRTRARLRCNLRDPVSVERFPQLGRLRELGCTEYVALPIELPGGRMNGITFATDDPGGFTEAHLAFLEGLIPFVSVILDYGSLRLALHSLMRVYLGPDAAHRVLQGKFRRGQGDSIRAVVWSCDMRGFSVLTDTRPASEVVATLDRYFEAVGGAVEQHGGEILKFIGDAVLAIFRVDERGPKDPAHRALAAVRDARTALAQLNRERTEQALGELGMGIGLHLGEVLYGNIGARERLDFTIIGKAVNEATRIEGQCKELGVPLLMSAEFVRAAELTDAVSLGVHTLRGVSAPHELFSLRELAPSIDPSRP